MMRKFFLQLMALFVGAAASADVWFVNINNETSIQDGVSWETAFRTLQPAIDAAFADGGGEVWVAAGVYDEPRELEDGRLVVHAGVQLFGGFNGNETDREDRNFLANETIIDGSTAFDGTHARSVVKTNDMTLVDGFTITNRATDDRISAIGLLHDTGSTTLRNINFRHNRSSGAGGIIVGGDIDMLVEDCVFEENSTWRSGGGAITHGGSGAELTVRRCMFVSNIGARSGGALNISGASTIVEDSIFSDNTSPLGGAVSIQSGGQVFERCQFINNEATESQGGAVWSFDGRMNFTNCVFADNQSAGLGGAISMGGNTGLPLVGTWNSILRFFNCTFANNTSDQDGGGALLVGTVQLVMHNNIVWDNGPMSVYIATPRRTLVQLNHTLIEGGLDEGVFRNNDENIFTFIEDATLDADPIFAAPAQGDYRLLEGSPAIDAADDTLAPEDDIEGEPRPQGPASDLGAFEGSVPAATLELDTEGEGTTEPPAGEPITTAAGTELTLTATAAMGWTFNQWTGDLPFAADPTANPLTLTLEADTTLTAVFILAPEPKCGMAAGPGATPAAPAGDALLLLALPLFLIAAHLYQQRKQRPETT